jgi:peptidoglycan/xylan/chitin deacetylase (PgdA/CDA1 family)
VRPQTIVVLAVVLVMLAWGGDRIVTDPRAGGDVSLAANVTAEQAPARDAATPSPTAPPASAPQPTLGGMARTTPTVTLPPTPTMAPTVAAAPSPTPRPEPPPTGNDQAAVVISQPQTGRQEVALTFDAGEGPGHTQEILDVLDQYGVVATFGVTGEWATANPDLMREIVARGHQVMNHAYTHGSFTGTSPGTAPMTPEQMRQEIVSTDEAIRATTNGYDTQGFFRFPYGDYDDQSLRVLKEAGYDYSVWWGCDSLAWMGNTAEDIVRTCGQEKLAPGLIVLLHVAQDADFAALPGLIERYQAAGYQMVTVEQLIQP